MNSTEKSQKSFRHLYNMIQNSDKIVLTSDMTLSSDEESFKGIQITKSNVLIDGNGHEINALLKSGIFEIKGKNIIFKNIRFKNGNFPKEIQKSSITSHGGAIRNYGTCSFIDCIFEKNISGIYPRPRDHIKDFISYGGAVYNTGTVTFENCIFEDNVAGSDFGYGDAIYNKGSCHIIDCTFKNNNIENVGACVISKTHFLESKSAILNSSDCEISNAVFKNISEYAVHNTSKSLKISDCSFNEVSGHTINNEKGNCEISKCSFIENAGEIIRNNETCKIFKCEFEDNDVLLKDRFRVSIKESLIRNDGYCICEDSNFKNNAGDTLIINSNQLNLHGCDFKQNNTGKHHIFQESEISKLQIKNANFEDNTSDIILDIEDGYSYAENIKFNNNVVHQYLISNRGDLSISKIQLKSNEKEFILNESQIRILKSDNIEDIIMSNFPIRYFNDISNESLIDGFSYLNSLIRKGDCIKLDRNIKLYDFEEKFFSRGIELNRDNLTIDGCGHEINAQKLSGIFYITGKNIILKNIVFKNGKHYYDYFEGDLRGGGAIQTMHDTLTTIRDCIFIDNESQKSAGAIYNMGDVKIMNTEFQNNFSKTDGGAIYNKGKCELIESNFTENRGPGIIYNFGIVKAVECLFDNNSFGNFINKGKSTFKKCSFKNNIGRDGGAIRNYGYCKVEKSDFIKNQALTPNGYGGGAIFNKGTCELLDCTFTSNESKLRHNDGGGAISNRGNLSIYKCNFYDNFTDEGEGGAILTGSSFKMTHDCIFKNNIPDNVRKYD